MPSTIAIRRGKESLEAENARLRARIQELEHPAHDLPFHAFDTMDRVARGVTYAVVEGLQSGVDALNVSADKVFGKSPKAHYEGRTNILSDLVSGLADGTHKLLETPRRISDRLFEAFEGPEDQRGRMEPAEEIEESTSETEAERVA